MQTSDIIDHCNLLIGAGLIIVCEVMSSLPVDQQASDDIQDVERLLLTYMPDAEMRERMAAMMRSRLSAAQRPHVSE